MLYIMYGKVNRSRDNYHKDQQEPKILKHQKY